MMNTSLELLPNEVIFHIFQYFDAHELFRAFYNINSRFNMLLQSMSHLSLTLLKVKLNEMNDCEVIAPYLYALKLDHTVNIDFNQFVNLRRLILISPTSNQLKQLVCNSLSCLEYLFVGNEQFLYSFNLPDVCNKIFSNGFPCLKSCSLFEPRILEILPYLTQTEHLSMLQMDNIDVSAFKSILSLCPNLNVFQFTLLNQQEESCSIKPHLNLKRIIIKYYTWINSNPNCAIKCYLSCVPNLEQLQFYDTNLDVNISEYMNFDWLSPSIQNYLPLLHRFKYYLRTFNSKQHNENVIKRIQTNFQQMHDKSYQSQLILLSS